MWGGAYGTALGIGGALLLLIVLGITLGAPIVAIPIVVVALIVIGLVDVRRRRRQARELASFRDEAKAEKVEFTARDKETLVSE